MNDATKGLDSQLDPIEYRDETGGSQEVSSELFIGIGDVSPIFDAAKEVLDFVSPTIQAPGTIGLLDGSPAVRHRWQSAFVPDLLALSRSRKSCRL